jgi:acid phosphatase family membrane protein YuiD
MPSFLKDALTNDVLWVSVIASGLAQFLKPFTHWLRTREFEWHHIADTGGMPSSHSALVVAAATGVGMDYGFDSGLFAIAIALAAVVTYDAAGVRREAGAHARALNAVIAELLKGHPIEKIKFKEVLGHSRMEVLMGIVFGVFVMLLWKLLIQPPFI